MKLFLTLVLIFVVSCSEDENKKINYNKSIVGKHFLNTKMQFNNTYPMFIAMLQLKNPALLEKVIVKNGVKKIDKELLAKIEEEQAQVLADLKRISPDIRVLYSYKRVMNGITILAPRQVSSQIEQMSSILSFESDQQFASPKVLGKQKVERFMEKINEINSVNYINADKVHKNISVIEPVTKDGEIKNQIIPVMGQGIRVGIIDTGVDYTHKMLGGDGDPEIYKAIDRFKPNEYFPNKKVVGGRDFVGNDFSTFTIYFDKFIPKPDENPIDVGGHGTHVAGTVAGKGDGLKTYSGVAPEADIYALKVFGDEDGGTSDSVVMAALEYATDPNEDFDLSDHLHVLNLSLGSGYGTPHQFYSYAIGNLAKFGIAVVASAGNSGDVDYITGSPGSSNDAFSVAAGIDDMLHNWKFDSVVIENKELNQLQVKAIEASFSVKIADLIDKGEVVSESLVYIGEAKNDLDDFVKEKLKGKVALIDRGSVSFVDKFKRAQNGGAIAVVMVNNKEEDPFPMGGDDESFEFKIPGIMIAKSVGDQIKKDVESTIVNFTSGLLVEEPDRIGTITSFSSKGPRSLDSAFKPEVTAPGQQIISASVGTGVDGVRLNGTSMSAPHMAGVMALMYQKHKSLSPKQLKSMVMGTAYDMKFIDKSKDNRSMAYLYSRQGAGMVDVYAAIEAPVSVVPSSLSLGEHSLVQSKVLKKKFKVTNVSDQSKEFSFKFVGSEEIKVNFESSRLTLKKLESKTVQVEIELKINEKSLNELNGKINILSKGEVVFSLPMLAVINQASQVKLDSFRYNHDIINNKQELDLLLSNSSQFDGLILPYNLLALDERKVKGTHVRLSTCDIQAVGYKYGTKEIDEDTLVNGQSVSKKRKIDILKMVVKTFNPLTNWHQCVVNVEFDTNLDGDAEYLLMAGRFDRMPFSSTQQSFVSQLLDSTKRQKLIDKNLQDNLSQEKSAAIPLDLSNAIISSLEAKSYDHSTVFELEVDTRQIAKEGLTGLRVSMSNVYGNDVEESDVLIGGTDSWTFLRVRDRAEPYMNLPSSISLEKSSSKLMSLVIENQKVKNPLMLVVPSNKFNFSRNINDNQMILLTPK